MRNILLVLGIVTLLATGAYGTTTAFFSDTETSTGNAFIAGSLDLQVGIDSETNTFPPQNLDNATLFRFENIRPGEMSFGDFVLASDSEVWACSAAEITTNGENGTTEAEEDLGDDASGGELAQYVEFATWEDRNDDKLVGTSERGSFLVLPLTTYANGTYYPIRDTDNGGEPISADSEYNLGFAYCYGSFAQNSDGSYVFEGAQPVCLGESAGNDSQSDTVEGTIYFYAEQSAGNQDFQCSTLGDVSGGDEQNDGNQTGDPVVELETVSAFAEYRYGNDNASSDPYELAIGGSEATIEDSAGFDLTSSTTERFSVTSFVASGNSVLQLDLVNANDSSKVGVDTRIEGTILGDTLVLTARIDEGQTITVTNLKLGIGDNDFSQADSVVSPPGTITLTDTDGDGMAQIVIRESEYAGLDFSGDFVLEGDVTFTYDQATEDRPELEFTIGQI